MAYGNATSSRSPKLWRSRSSLLSRARALEKGIERLRQEGAIDVQVAESPAVQQLAITAEDVKAATEGGSR